MPNQSDLVNLVVQNPSRFFRDPELRTAATQKRPGITTAWNWGSGGFGWVYRMALPSGKTYAVKFFKAEDPARDQRAGQITSFLKSLNPYPKYLIDFAYIEKATSYKQNVLKLEWVEGLEMQAHLERRANDGAALLSVSQQIADCIRELQRLNIAHGDLQQGNILVDGKNKIRLVDYDGMFIPSFSGLKATEDGLPSCQHPGRTRVVFNSRIDSFSALGLILTFRAIGARPELLRMFPVGSDRLLFAPDDYNDPSRSALFTELANSKDAGIRRLTEVLAGWCAIDFDKIPELKTVLDPLEQSQPKFWNDIETGRIGRQTASPGTAPPGRGLAWRPAPSVSSGASVKPPSISSVVTSPATPVTGQPFTLIITGDNFDPVSASALLTGRQNGSRTLSNGSLSKKTANMIVGATDVAPWGTWNVTVRNAQGTPSNSMPIVVQAVTTVRKTWPKWKVAGTAIGVLVCALFLLTFLNRPPPTIVFLGTPTETVRGQPVTLSWSVENGSNVSIEPGFGAVTPRGVRMVSPAVTTVYTLTARGSGGTTSREITVKVAAQVPVRRTAPVPAPPPSVSSVSPPLVSVFRADSTHLDRGGKTSLRWSVTGGTVRIEPGIGVMPAEGNATVSPVETTDYTLRVEGPGGRTSNRVTVIVESPLLPPPIVREAQPPVITAFEAVPATVEQCNVAILRWTVRGATRVAIAPEVGTVQQPSGYRVVRPVRSTRYTLRAEGSGGAVDREVTLAVTNPVKAACGPN